MHEFPQSALSQRWRMSWGERKTFRLTLSLFVLMCRESPSINNKNCCLRACPKGLISSMDPRPCHWDGSLRPELEGNGSLCCTKYVLIPLPHTTTQIEIHAHIMHVSASWCACSSDLETDKCLDTHLYLKRNGVRYHLKVQAD